MIKFNFLLQAQNKGLLPSYTGHIVRGAVLTKIQEHRPKVADLLHEENVIRPYSISPLFPHRERIYRTRRGEIKVREGDTLQFNLGALTNELAQEVLQINLLKEKVNFTLTKVDFTTQTIKVERLDEQELFKEGGYTKFRLEFLTPTYFSIKKQDFPLRFPDPRYLFSNIANIWNAHQPADGILIDQEDFYEWLENNVSISGYDLRTRTAYISKGAPVIGFKGWAHYRLSEEDKKYHEWINALCNYAEISNIGGGRTAGFGCIRYKPKRQLTKKNSSSKD
jgi:CRISPR-associated endoribonuclease Cas6